MANRWHRLVPCLAPTNISGGTRDLHGNLQVISVCALRFSLRCVIKRRYQLLRF
jgi:hypothetical protein